MTKGSMPEEFPMKEFTLNQDDFIEWILHHTNDAKAVFRVYEAEHYISVGIDKLGLEYITIEEDNGYPD